MTNGFCIHKELSPIDDLSNFTAKGYLVLQTSEVEIFYGQLGSKLKPGR